MLDRPKVTFQFVSKKDKWPSVRWWVSESSGKLFFPVEQEFDLRTIRSSLSQKFDFGTHDVSSHGPGGPEWHFVLFNGLPSAIFNCSSTNFASRSFFESAGMSQSKRNSTNMVFEKKAPSATSSHEFGCRDYKRKFSATKSAWHANRHTNNHAPKKVGAFPVLSFSSSSRCLSTASDSFTVCRNLFALVVVTFMLMFRSVMLHPLSYGVGLLMAPISWVANAVRLAALRFNSITRNYLSCV